MVIPGDQWADISGIGCSTTALSRASCQHWQQGGGGTWRPQSQSLETAGELISSWTLQAMFWDGGFFLVSSLGIPCYIWGMAIGLSLVQGHIYVYIHMATLIKTLIGQPQHTATAEKQSRQQSSRKSSKVHSIHCVVFEFITVFPQLASCFIINALERPVSQRC